MVVVAMVAAIVVVVVVVKVLVRAAAIVSMVAVVEVLVSGVLTDVEIIAVRVIVIVLKVSLPMPYSLDVPSGLFVDSFMDASAGVVRAVLPAIGVGVLAVVMTPLEFPVSTPLEECSR